MTELEDRSFNPRIKGRLLLNISRYTILCSQLFLKLIRGVNMAIFPETKERRLRKKICRKCTARNPWTATQCRKCGSKQLRPKKGEKKVK